MAAWIEILLAPIVLALAFPFFGYTTAWHSGWRRLSVKYRTTRSFEGGTWTVRWPRVGRAFLTLKIKVEDDGLLLRGRVIPPFVFIGTGIHDLFIPWGDIHDVQHLSIFFMHRTRFVAGTTKGVEFEIKSSLLQGSPLERPLV